MHHHHRDEGWRDARAAVFHDDETEEAHDRDHERFGLDDEPCRWRTCPYRRYDD